MNEWLLIVAANLVVFVWGLHRYIQTVGREADRGKIMARVREWDEEEQELGSAFCGVTFKSWRWLWTEGTASWKRPDGQVVSGWCRR